MKAYNMLSEYIKYSKFNTAGRQLSVNPILQRKCIHGLAVFIFWRQIMPKGIKGFQKGQRSSPEFEFKKGHIPFSKLHPEDMPRGEEHPKWRGGKYKNMGYVYIQKPDHPFRTKQGYVLEHRLVIEQQIGRFLQPQEHVHHINKIKDDNRLENLIAFVSNSVHINFEHGNNVSDSEIIFDGGKKTLMDDMFRGFRR